MLRYKDSLHPAFSYAHRKPRYNPRQAGTYPRIAGYVALVNQEKAVRDQIVVKVGYHQRH
jgi:hypothetical protein